MADEVDGDRDPYHFVLRRRPQPEAPPPFHCEACNRTITPSPWPYHRHESPPVCGNCTRLWMSVSRLGMTGCTRGDFRRLERLSAFINLITCEVRNGHR